MHTKLSRSDYLMRSFKMGALFLLLRYRLPQMFLRHANNLYFSDKLFAKLAQSMNDFFRAFHYVSNYDPNSTQNLLLEQA